MSKTINLGRVTAYADAVAAGYTGTREQFANDLANAANYAAEAGDAAETATEAATTASTAAGTATEKAEEASADADQAHADAQAILGAKETAVAAAATASSKAGEAANSAQQAAASETAAAGSATTASNAATSATASKNAAATSETNAANSANAAAQTLTNVNQAGATQVAAIQAKGTEVLNSIPADYTTLSNDVDDLKSDLNTVGELANIKAVEVTNLLGKDGNFEDFVLSANTWYLAKAESTATETDNVLTFNAVAQYGSIRHSFPAYANHKYYFFGTVKTLSTSGYISINVDNPLMRIPGDDSFHYVSGVYTRTVDGATVFCISDSSSSPQNIYVQKCGVIDLTATFGAGKEPSKDEMDNAMQMRDYFILQGNLYFTIDVPKAYQGKKILFMGDSITAANLNDNGWCKYFNEIMKPSLSVNVAVSGATWRDKDGTVYDGNPSTYDTVNNTIGNQVEKIARGKDTSNPNYSHVSNYDDFDIIIISAGTNDGNSYFNPDNIRGALVDNYSNPIPYTSIDTKTSVGAMVYAYERMYTMYPNARYYYCTPIQAYPAKKEWGEIQHKGEVMKETGNYIPPIIIDSEKCGIFGSQEKYNTEGVNLVDGLHPNAHGAKLLGVYNANAVISHLLTDL